MVKCVSREECLEILLRDSDCAVIDVRTEQEWKEVGVPELSGIALFMIEWMVGPDRDVNTNFILELDNCISESGMSRDTKLFFLCASGGRSLQAAQAAEKYSYSNCYNIEGGLKLDDGEYIKEGYWRPKHA